MAICGIYKIISPTDRVYIGQGVNIKRRFYRYKSLDCKEQIILYKSFLKHGVENHSFEIIEECPVDDLNCRERHWQDFYDVLNGGLNCVLQECGEERYVISEETRKKQSNSAKGRVWSEESKEKGRQSKLGDKNPMYGSSGELSPTFGRKHTEQDVINIKQGIKNKGEYRLPISEEHKLSISKANSKRVIDKETGKIYNSAKEAAEVFGINAATLRCYLTGSIKNKTKLEYYKN